MHGTPLPQITNATDWAVTVAVIDDTTGVGFDLSTYTAITVRVTDSRNSQMLTGTLSDGTIVVTADDDAVSSILSWTFRASEMATLAAGSYTVAVKIGDGTNTTQLILGRLPVVDGGFTA